MPSRAWGVVVLAVVVVTGLLVYGWTRRSRSANRTPVSGKDLSGLVAQALVQRFGASGIVTSEGGGALRVGERTLAVHASIDNVKAGEGRFYVGLDIRCFADGTTSDALHSGSVGVDDTADSAVRTAIREWVLQYGTPIVGALHKRPEEGLLIDSFRAGRFVIYPGLTGFPRRVARRAERRLPR